jgi:two-component system NtrC family sensor kinase
VSSSLDISRVLREIARAAATLMAAPVVSFWIADEAARTVEAQAFSDESLGADFPARKLAFGQGGAGWVATHRQPLDVPDVFADERLVAHEWWRAHDLRSFFGLPIFQDGALLAVLAFNGRKPFAFGPDDQILLESFMAQAALAIRNARLFAEIQERTTHLGQINDELRSEINERTLAEEALRASEQRFRSLVQSANDAIVLADSRGHITAWNRGAEVIFGYTEAEVVGQPLTFLMPARYREAYQRGLERQRDHGESRLIGKTTEFQGLRKDGSELALEISLASWVAGGNTFFSGIIRDISARKQVEEQLHRQQEALFQREKLAAMGSLLASVAHELNNPLSVVMMQADLLGTERKDEPPAELVKAISQSAERCVNIVRNFLALARQNPPQRTPVALNSVVEEAMTLLTYTLRVDNIDVHLDLADDIPALWADPHQLHQVVINVITNAHQALREVATPRRLTLTTRYHQAHQAVSLEVADTGPGIPPALQERIFEPFFTTKPPGVGTGLGLPFCRGIIEAHGGSLGVTSAPEQGAIFRIELPVDAVPAAAAPPPMVELAPPAEGKAILVVDDEPGIASALAYLLRRDGHTVETAAHGRLALGKLQERTYDVILCDLRMPELDGPGFYRELEHHYPHLRSCIIFLTGDTLSPETQAFLEEVGAPRLNKPFRATEARRMIHQVLQAR